MISSDNLSTLFSNLSKGSAFNSVDLNQYSLIKSGAYGKALKAYYAKNKDSIAKDSAVSDSKKTNKSVVSAYNSLKTEASALSESLSELSKMDIRSNISTDDGKAVLEKTVNNFVSSYNTVLSQSDKVVSTEIKSLKSNMNSMSSVMSKYLSDIGITQGTDGKLSVNKDKLYNSKSEDVASLFQGNNSYGEMIKGYSDSINKAAISNTLTYNSSGTAVSNLSGIFESLV